MTVDPFKVIFATRPRNWARRQRIATFGSLIPILCMARPLRPRFTGGNPFDEADASHNGDVEVNPDDVLF